MIQALAKKVVSVLETAERDQLLQDKKEDTKKSSTTKIEIRVSGKSKYVHMTWMYVCMYMYMYTCMYVW